MLKRVFLLFNIFLFQLFFLHGQSDTSTGTGFFITADGVIVTCAHVVQDANTIRVTVGNNSYNADLLAINMDTDVAILKINRRPSKYFRLANFNNANLGDKVFVLGFPLSGLLSSDIRLTDGILSAKSGLGTDQTYFQISAPIQPGNSGGPIFNERFEILGIAAAKLDDMITLIASGSIPQNVNFGIKNTFISSVMPNLRIRGGNVQSMNDAITATVQIIVENKTLAARSSITITNNTGYTVYYAYVSPSDNDNWGRDVLGTDILANGSSVTVQLPYPLSEINRYDIKLIDLDGDSYTKWNLTLAQNGTIRFTFDDFDTRQVQNTTPTPNTTPSTTPPRSPNNRTPSNPTPSNTRNTNNSRPRNIYDWFGYSYINNMPIGLTLGLSNFYASLNVGIGDSGLSSDSDNDEIIGQIEWIVGYAIPINSFLQIPIGLGLNHTGIDGYDDFIKDFVFEAGIQLILKYFYLSATYRPLRKSFVFGAGFIW